MKRIGMLLLSVILGVSLLGCKKKPSKSAGSSPAPLSERSWLLGLDVAGFGAAKVALPLGAQSPRPILVALHGDFDRPEWACGSYRPVVGPKAFVLCPAGVPLREGRFGLGSVAETERELRASLRALKTRYGQHVAKGSVVLAALGPSVEQAITIALQEPSFFSALVLVDGSLRRLDTAAATRYGQAGGQRVLVLCSPGGCDADAEVRVRALKPQGVDARLVRTERGHGLDADAVQALTAEWRWVKAKDKRWQ